MTFFLNIKRFHRHNVDTVRRSPMAEISGALGDLGTLLPLMITLAVNGSISLSTTLVFSGFFNFATGVIFGIPLPVQPMKAIAAAAIASRASQRETVAAGVGSGPGAQRRRSRVKLFQLRERPGYLRTQVAIKTFPAAIRITGSSEAATHATGLGGLPLLF
ncbi:hypothetical protein DL765_006443 [Monosporascus sp. GIB2]|nr:hypothetical protein DL765_006443 [Monosporascus sp. GIB2]